MKKRSSVLQEVRSVAREAAKSGHGWHEKKGGAIQCHNGHCTLAAIMFKRSEPARELQARFDQIRKDTKALIRDQFRGIQKDARKLVKELKGFGIEVDAEPENVCDELDNMELFEEGRGMDPDLNPLHSAKEFEGFPDPGLAAEILKLPTDLCDIVTEANDTSLKTLRRELADEKERVLDEEGSLATDIGYQESLTKVKARIILERELLGRKSE